MENTRIVVAQYGGPEVLQAVKEPLRPPGPGEVRVKVQTAGVALADVMRREGKYPNSPQPPFTPGYDAVGTVDACGEGVKDFAPGDRVGVFYNGIGGYAAYAYAPQDQLFRVPADVDAAEATAVVLNYVTAWQMLHRLARVEEGERILIHGAAGGVGTALLELGRLAGLRMFGTASRAKLGIVEEAGATPIDYRAEDFVRSLARLAPEGMDAVFDPIGGDNWRRSYRTLGTKGRFVGYGFTSVLGETDGGAPAREWQAVASAGRTEYGHPAFTYSITTLKAEKPEWFREDLQVLFRLLESGRIRPRIAERIPLREAASAQLLLEQSRVAGKIVLTAT